MLESSWLQEQTQHPSAVDKIRNLEAPKTIPYNEDEVNYGVPTFTSHLNNVEIFEHGTAVLECKVEPFKDPSLKIGKIKNFLM